MVQEAPFARLRSPGHQLFMYISCMQERIEWHGPSDLNYWPDSVVLVREFAKDEPRRLGLQQTKRRRLMQSVTQPHEPTDEQ